MTKFTCSEILKIDKYSVVLIFQRVLPQISNPLFTEARKHDLLKDKIASTYLSVLSRELSHPLWTWKETKM